MGTESQGGLGDDLQRVEEYLYYADGELEGIARRIETLIKESNPDIDVEYDLSATTIEVNISHAETVRRLNERLSWPLVAMEKDGQLEIKNLNRDVDISGTDSLADAIQQTIESLSHVGESGAPVDLVIDYARSQGHSTEEVQEEIRELRQKGELYSPRSNEFLVV